MIMGQVGTRDGACSGLGADSGTRSDASSLRWPQAIIASPGGPDPGPQAARIRCMRHPPASRLWGALGREAELTSF